MKDNLTIAVTFAVALYCLFVGLEFLDLPIDVLLGLPGRHACNTLYTDLFATISYSLTLLHDVLK